MSGNPAWDPQQYLRFAGERLRPALDLIARIPGGGAAGEPGFVVDLGCGAGSVLPALHARFPTARLLGVDGSAAMLAQAAATGFATAQADIATWRPDAPADVLFSNAALHWLGDHPALFPRLLDCVAPGGVLAVQIPAMSAAPFRAVQQSVARAGPWASRLAGVTGSPPVLEPAAYHDLLSPRCATLDLWVTEYLHVLRGPDPVVQWMMGSGLRPALDALADDSGLRAGFLQAYAEALRPYYPPRPDGTVLLTFRRLFILAQRSPAA